MLEKIHNPLLVQGTLQKKRYFEGWYFKQVSQKQNKAISFIPGFSTNPSDPHCFIQVISSPPVETHYFRFPLESFQWTDAPFSVQIGDSCFRENSLEVHLQNQKIQISGSLTFSPLTPIHTSWIEPNIMGFFAYIPGMECNHGVLSMNHEVNGTLTLNGEPLMFEKDRGYIEKDWGTSFPSNYIWIQANHFPQIGDSLFLSIARIPLLSGSFQGFISNVVHNGKEYRFATYNGAKIELLNPQAQSVNLLLTRGKLRLSVTAEVLDTAPLKAPLHGQMAQTIKEGLGGTVRFQLHNGEELLCDLKSPFAGIEIVQP